jgi:hypothetical protein
MDLERNPMTRTLITGLLALTLFHLTFGQKRMTVIGNSWTGEVVATDDSKREITIKYEDKGKSETLVGVLAEGFKVTMKDGSSRELGVSEITRGERIRVFYKTKEQEVGGIKAKVNIISRIDFLGSDEFARLREQLNVSPSMPVTVSATTGFPSGDPLKVCLAIEDPKVSESFADWLGEWNKGQAQKYGSLEIVSDVAQADVYLVSYRGLDTAPVQLPIEFYDSSGNLHRGSYATAYVVAREGQGLKVLSKQRIIITDRSESSIGLIEKEFEKRMKARSQPRKK